MKPEQIIEFIGSNFDKMKNADNIEDTQYTLTVHDLLSAFRDFDPCASCKNYKTVGQAKVFDVECEGCSNFYASKWSEK